MTHRIVAAEAAVPLSATTYYFKSKTDLLTEAFRYHEEHPTDDVREFALPVLDPGTETCSIDLVIESIVALITRGMTEGRDDLVTRFELDLEATRRSELRELERPRKARLTSWLADAMEVLGSTDPASDALSLMFLLSGMEFHALSRGRSSLDPSQRSALARVLKGLLGASEPARVREMKRRSPRGGASNGVRVGALATAAGEGGD